MILIFDQYRFELLFDIIFTRIVISPSRFSSYNFKQNIKDFVKINRIHNPFKLLTKSLVLLQLSKIVTIELQGKLYNTLGLQITDDHSKALNLFILSLINNIVAILIYEPMNIVKHRLIVQEMSIVGGKDEVDDKERSVNTYDTVSNIRKHKYKGLIDCVRCIKEYVQSL